MGSFSNRLWDRVLPTVTNVSGPDLQAPDVRFEDGLAILVNRGILKTTASFPSGLSFKLRWTHQQGAGTYCDHLIIGLRTSGKPREVWSHELEDGVLVRFTPQHGSISVDDAATQRNVQVFSGLDMQRCVWHDIKVVDDGRTISVFFGDLERPRFSVELPDTSAHHHVAIYNREAVGHVNKMSAIDEVEIWAPAATPYPPQ